MNARPKIRVRVVLVISLVTACLSPVTIALGGPNTWTTTGPPNGTFTFVAPSPDYATDHTLFAGGTYFGAAGIFESTSTGEPVWNPRITGLPPGAHVNALAVSPAFAADRTVFACTDMAIYQSTDGGDSWAEADNGLPDYPDFPYGGGLESLSIHAVAFSPGFATDHTVFVGGTTFGAAGIFRSTSIDTTWTACVTGLPPEAAVNALAVSPAYASDHTVLAATDRGIYKSVNSGDSWVEADTGLPDYPGFPYGGGLESLPMRAVAFSPAYATDHTTFAGGRTFGAGGIFKSTSIDTSWTAVVTGLPPEAVPNSIAISPAYPADGTVFAATDAGFYMSADGGVRWSAFNAGLTYPAFSVAVSPAYATDATVFVGSNAAYSYTLSDLVVTPIAGKTRVDTAIVASKEAFADGSSQWAIVTTAYNWPDALGGSALAGALDCPILLTAPDALATTVADEIGRLGATDVIVLGGESAVLAETYSAIGALPGVSVQRIAGADRYATAEAIASRAIAELGAAYDGSAFVATGRNFPDALGASPLAAAKGWPIYLADPAKGDNLALATAMAAGGVSNALILGGDAAVAPGVETTMRSTVGSARRLYGGSRYTTAIEVAGYGVDNAGLHWDELALATGTNFPDALSGGVLQGKAGSVMLLTPATSLDPGVAATLAANKTSVRIVRFLGGTGAISDAVRTQVANILE